MADSESVKQAQSFLRCENPQFDMLPRVTATTFARAAQREPVAPANSPVGKDRSLRLNAQTRA